VQQKFWAIHRPRQLCSWLYAGSFAIAPTSTKDSLSEKQRRSSEIHSPKSLALTGSK